MSGYFESPEGRRAAARAALDVLLCVAERVWVTSDSHWEHKNIQRYEDRPDGHYDLMRRRWFETVAADDVVIHLGDLCVFGNKRNYDQWVSGLAGRKYLLLGNHDAMPQEWYEGHGFSVLGRDPFFWTPPKNAIVGVEVAAFSHEPLDGSAAFDVNIHGHLHSNEHREGGRTPKHINVCVELHDYRPVDLADLLTPA